MQKFSIVIPIYNEEKNILKLIDEIKITLNKKYIFEIICINDASTDNSLEILNNIKHQNINIINHPNNFGQSKAIYNGILKASYEVVVTIDADLQNDPKDIPNLVNFYFEKKIYGLVGGIRNNRKDSLIKKYASKIANIFRSWILQDGCMDTGCSLKVFDKRTFLSLEFFNSIHRFLPALFVGAGKKTFFLNVNHRKRIYGLSKYGIFNRLFIGIVDTFRVLKMIKKMKKTNLYD